MTTLAAVGLRLVERRRVALERGRVDQRPDQRPGVQRRRRSAATRTPRASRSTSSSTIDECAITRRSVVQRWPAVPAAAKTMPRTARSRSADGATIAALLPPSSSSSRPRRPATRGATARPIRVEPVALSKRDARVVDQGLADRRSADARLTTAPAGAPTRRAASASERLAGQRGEQRLLGRLPHDRVAADEGQRGVPRPDRDREVERADDTDDAQRVPLLHHPVARPLGGDGQPEQLAGQADREVADVDHLLNLAQPLGADLAGLDRHQRAEIGLVFAQQLAELADELPTYRGRHRPPTGEGIGCGGRSMSRTCSASVFRHPCELRAGDR